MKAALCWPSTSLVLLTHHAQVQVQAHLNSNAKPHRIRLARPRYDPLPAPLQHNHRFRNPYRSLHGQVLSRMNSRRPRDLTPVDLGVEPVRNLTSLFHRKHLTMRILAAPMRHLLLPANPAAPILPGTRTAALNVVVRTGILSCHLQARARLLSSLLARLDPATRSHARRPQYRVRIRMLTTRIERGQATQGAGLLVPGRAQAMASKHPSAHCRQGI